jgi:maltose alpha-D-glucosyltransferase / alpha-amylase
VRTPMQWSPDRNGGFSKADPQNLFLPPIMDPIYGYESVNVEAQSREPSSMLNWMRRILAIRKERQAFGRGTLKFLRPGNRKVLAYLREYRDEVLLCVANLARSAQPVELDLRRFKGRVPVELLGKTPFPPIGDLPYLLTLPAHAFYWFRLAAEHEVEIPAWHEEHLLREEPPWLVLFAGLASFNTEAVGEAMQALAETLRSRFRTDALPRFLRHQRWFAGKGETLDEARLVSSTVWEARRETWLMTFVEAVLGADSQQYFLPLAAAWETEHERLAQGAPTAVARIRQRSRTGLLFDAFGDERFCRDLLEGLATQAVVELGGASLHFLPTRAFGDLTSDEIEQQRIRRTPTEGSNSTLLIGDHLFLKGYRRVRRGANPEWEMGRFLTDVSPCGYTVPVAGAVEYRVPGEEPIMLALVQAAVQNQGDGWSYTRDYLSRYVESERLQPGADEIDGPHRGFLMLMRMLGARTAALHRALAIESGDPAFDPEPIERQWLAGWAESVAVEAELTLRRLAERSAELPATAAPWLARLLDPSNPLAALIERVTPREADAAKTRYHGDYHLGQVLIVENDFVITDLEGEPGRTMEERRAKHTPLKDVAGMLRSFAYAKDAVARTELGGGPAAELERVERLLGVWVDATRDAFLAGYREAIDGSPACPRDLEQQQGLLALAALEKMLYEIRYELDNRPDWVELPLRHLHDFVAAGSGGALTSP